MAAASVVHSRLQVNLAHELRKTTDYAVYSELTIVVDGEEYKPDLCAYSYRDVDWKHDVVRTTELPLLAIEIVSPRQTIQEVVEKIDLYLKAGIQSCWLIVSYPRTITIYSGPTEQVFTSGDLIDKTLNIKIAIQDVFR